MPPRIRSLFPAPLVFARAAPRPAPQADAPTVFREFVTQLERLDAQTPLRPARRRARRRVRSGNGDARRPRQRTSQ